AARRVGATAFPETPVRVPVPVGQRPDGGQIGLGRELERGRARASGIFRVEKRAILAAINLGHVVFPGLVGPFDVRDGFVIVGELHVSSLGAAAMMACSSSGDAPAFCLWV